MELNDNQRIAIGLYKDSMKERLLALTGHVPDVIIRWRLKSEKELAIDEFVEEVKKYCCEANGITKQAIEGKTRKREAVEARQIAQYMLCNYTKLSLKKIGLHFGGRAHTTVIHSKQTVNDLMETDKKYKAKVEMLEGMVTELSINNKPNTITI